MDCVKIDSSATKIYVIINAANKALLVAELFVWVDGMKEYAKQFYRSQAWRRTRAAYAKSVNGLCERCKQAGDIVHHKIYITQKNINNPDIVLNWNNLELLCQDCHNKEHMSALEKRYRVDKNGNILPPAAGKNMR